jgi:hypothetical protein
LRVMPGTGRHHRSDDPVLDRHLNLFLRERCYAFTGCAGVTLKGRVTHLAFGSGRSAVLGGSGHMGRRFRFPGIGTLYVLGKTASLSASAHSRPGSGFLRERWN